MKYVKVNASEAVQQMAASINQALEQGSVLLLVSGGSNIETAVEIRNQLHIMNPLTVGLIDERYGLAGHADSNWFKLLNAGFNTDDVTLLTVLEERSFDETAADYRKRLEQAFQTHDTFIGIFGLGADGHTAGVLPHSEAVNAKEIVTNYVGADFRRITTTPAAFRHFDTAFLVAYGESKRPQLEALARDLPIDDQPAQALKQAKQLVIYNDQVNGDDNQA